MTHVFFDPELKAHYDLLIHTDNLRRAKDGINRAKAALEEAGCGSCESCDCQEGQEEARTINDYASDFGITLSTPAQGELTRQALKEMVKRGEQAQRVPDGSQGVTRVFPISVLEKVFAPVLEESGRV